MSFFLSRQAALKWLETPAVYHIGRDELYELDADSFRFLGSCNQAEGSESPDSAFIDYCIDEGILSRERVDVRRPPLRRSPEPSLRYLELQVTNRCNLRCRHCYLGDGGSRELSLELIGSALREFEAMQGLRVLLTGGEPLLHSRFEEVNELLSGLFLRTVLFTNGTLLTKDVLSRLKVHEIQISIDGMQQAHDAVRGTGSWRRSIDALHLALDRGFAVAVSTMVLATNLGDFDAMEELFRNLGVREWTVDVPCATGRLAGEEGLLVGPERGGKYLGYGYGGGMHASGAGYACGLHLMSIQPDGTAAKCTFYADRPAGAISEGLQACWSRIRPRRLDSLECSCTFIDACRGGCRYRAELLGNASGRDLYRCSLYGIIDRPEER
ncbi:MAG: radical SAM protein [Nitrospiraceae bacterium]|nr:radical SAM protein [Nitrospiraceae bacterium]